MTHVHVHCVHSPNAGAMQYYSPATVAPEGEWGQNDKATKKVQRTEAAADASFSAAQSDLGRQTSSIVRRTDIEPTGKSAATAIKPQVEEGLGLA